MIDNITLMMEASQPPEAIKAGGQPFEYKGQTYCPKYTNKQLRCYEAQIKNLRLYLYPERIYLTNSLHKFYHGNNYGDFYLSELRAAIEAISDATGYDWAKAAIKKMEYACNISSNGSAVAQSLISYQGRDYLPMARDGKAYGKAWDAAKVTLKGYDKQMQVKLLDKLQLNTPMFRWEIVAKYEQHIQRLFSCDTVTAGQMLSREGLKILAADACKKFNDTLKKQIMNLHLLTVEQLKMVAVMENEVLREDFKRHHKRTYKRYRIKYRELMNNKTICPDENTGQEIARKFDELLSN